MVSRELLNVALFAASSIVTALRIKPPELPLPAVAYSIKPMSMSRPAPLTNVRIDLASDSPWDKPPGHFCEARDQLAVFSRIIKTLGFLATPALEPTKMSISSARD